MRKNRKRWERIRFTIMETSKVRYCPVCGEQLSLFDRTHVREKHPKYFHEVRKWQLRFSLSLASLSLFLIFDTLYPNAIIRLFSSIVTLIASGSVFFFALKWRSAEKRTRLNSCRATKTASEALEQGHQKREHALKHEKAIFSTYSTF